MRNKLLWECKTRIPFPPGLGGVLPFPVGRMWLVGVPTAFPFWAWAPLTDWGISSVDQGSRGVAIMGIPINLPSRGIPWLPPGTPSHQIFLGGCPPVGNPFPGHPSFLGTHPGVPPLICRPYILFSLRNHYLISLFEKCSRKNVRNKIQKKFQTPQDIIRVRSR